MTIRNTNVNIMANELLARGLMSKEDLLANLKEDPTGKNLPFRTADEWKKKGFYIKKGEHSLFKIQLWRVATRKGEDGKWETVSNEDGTPKYIKPYCHIFSESQVIAKGKKQLASEEKKEFKKEKNIKKATRKTTTKVVETKKDAPKKATMKLAKAPTMIRKDFIKEGIKMVEFVASDNSKGFTMPLAKYENMSNKKRFDKMWGIA